MVVFNVRQAVLPERAALGLVDRAAESRVGNGMPDIVSRVGLFSGEADLVFGKAAVFCRTGRDLAVFVLQRKGDEAALARQTSDSDLVAGFQTAVHGVADADVYDMGRIVVNVFEHAVRRIVTAPWVTRGNELYDLAFQLVALPVSTGNGNVAVAVVVTGDLDNVVKNAPVVSRELEDRYLVFLVMAVVSRSLAVLDIEDLLVGCEVKIAAGSDHGVGIVEVAAVSFAIVLGLVDLRQVERFHTGVHDHRPVP